jgi:hypothetical protein
MEHTLKSLKKMNSERLHKLYNEITGTELFNPYSERELMIITIMGHQTKFVTINAKRTLVHTAEFLGVKQTKKNEDVTQQLKNLIVVVSAEVRKEQIQMAVMEQIKQVNTILNSFLSG